MITEPLSKQTSVIHKNRKYDQCLFTITLYFLLIIRTWYSLGYITQWDNQRMVGRNSVIISQLPVLLFSQIAPKYVTYIAFNERIPSRVYTAFEAGIQLHLLLTHLKRFYQKHKISVVTVICLIMLLL